MMCRIMSQVCFQYAKQCKGGIPINEHCDSKQCFQVFSKDLNWNKLGIIGKALQLLSLQNFVLCGMLPNET